MKKYSNSEYKFVTKAKEIVLQTAIGLFSCCHAPSSKYPRTDQVVDSASPHSYKVSINDVSYMK